MSSAFYRWFSDRQLTRFGLARRERIQRFRLSLLHKHRNAPGDIVEIGPGTGGFAKSAISSGWSYRGFDASEVLANELRSGGLKVTQAWVPPMPIDDQSCDVVYADQVLEHMSGIDMAREFVNEASRVLRPGGVFLVVVPDYLKEKEFFWDIDYTHNFVTTDRRVRQLLYDGGFEMKEMVRSIGVATGFGRNMLAAAALFVNIPGVDALSRFLRTEEFLFRVRKNLFETLSFIARKPL